MKMKKISLLIIGLAILIVVAAAIPPSMFSQQSGPESAPPQPKDQPQAPTPPPSSQNKPEYSISVQSNLVNVDVVVTNQDGDILTGFKKENFKIYDDGQLQQITNFTPTEAPLTIVMLMEYSARFWDYYAAKGVYWGSDLLNHLQKDDWVALVTYSMRTTVQLDFTQNKMDVERAIETLGFPDFHEANEFDALIETLDRLQDVKGKRAVVLLTTGADTFSKHTYDQTLKRLRQNDVPIFSVALGEVEEEMADAMGQMSGAASVGYLQDKNELQTFGKMSGGYAWFPRFDGEIPSIFATVAAFLRNQYTLGFSPSDTAQDGKYHKLKVEVVQPDGSPFMTTNKKGKHQKVVAYYREGYTAPTGSVQ